MATQPAQQFKTVIIGGGQAGLAAGYHLARQGERFVILDAGDRVGDSWRQRWPSLRLYSPARYDGLPGMAFPAPRHSSPTGSEMADYLEAYAKRFDLPVRTGVHVDGLSLERGRFVVSAGEQRFEADSAVVATGVMQEPVVPEFAGQLDPAITQLHSFDYRDPGQLQDGEVLVVGAAHSGADIALEVSATRHAILCGRDTGQIPVPLESRRMRLTWPVVRFLFSRVLTMNTPVGRKKRAEVRAHGGPALRVKQADLAAAGVERVLERVVGVRDGLPLLADGRVVDVANVIWCTGFRPNYGWIDLPLELEEGYPRQDRGAVPSVPGLYFIGMIFLHSFSSMLIFGAVRDAKRVAKQIAARRAKRRVGSRKSAAGVATIADEQAS